MKNKVNQDLEQPQGQEEKQGMWPLIKETLVIFVVACLLASVIKVTLIDSRIVPTPSMVPTVQVNDRVLMNKIPYYFNDPERGDIVVFRPTAAIGEKDDMLKRVIGVGGDTVEVKDETVFVNGEPLVEPYLAEKPDYVYGPVTVPEGMCFMMGDNRNHSYDSHQWPDPFIPVQNVKGRVFMTYWPLTNFGRLE